MHKVAINNFKSAFQKIDNIVRNDFMLRLLEVPEEDLINVHNFAKIFEDYFTTSTAANSFEKYGGITKILETKQILHDYKKIAMQKWLKAIAEANINYSIADQVAFEKNIDLVVEQALSNCSLLNSSSASFLPQEYEQQMEVNTLKINSVETELELEQELE